MDQDNVDGQSIQAVERAFDIIEYLRTHGSATATEVSSELEYSSSTAHIHLKTLVDVGFVVKDDNEYSLGLRFLRAGTSVRERMPLFRAAKSEIDSLAEETGEGVGIAVEENGKRVSIYHARGADSVHENAPIGEFTNTHWTALGKALLAYKDPAKVIAILERHRMPKATEHPLLIGTNCLRNLRTHATAVTHWRPKSAAKDSDLSRSQSKSATRRSVQFQLPGRFTDWQTIASSQYSYINSKKHLM